MGERGRLVDGTVDPGFTWGHAEPPVHIQEVETLSFYGRDLHCTTRGSLLRPVGLQESTSRLTAPPSSFFSGLRAQGREPHPNPGGECEPRPRGHRHPPFSTFWLWTILRTALPFDSKRHQKCRPSSFMCQSVLSSALGTFPSLPPLPGSQVTEQLHFASKLYPSALSRKIWDNSISQRKLL